MLTTGVGSMQILVQLMQGEATKVEEESKAHHVFVQVTISVKGDKLAENLLTTLTTRHHTGKPGRRLLAPRVSVARSARGCLRQRRLGEPTFGEQTLPC